MSLINRSELPDDEEAYLFFEKNAYIPDDNVIYEDGNRSFCVTGDMIMRLLANKSESDVKKLLYENDDRLANMKYIQTWNNGTTGIMDIYEVRKKQRKSCQRERLQKRTRKS